MLELMGRQEKDIQNKVIEQLMLKLVSNTRKVIREVTIWKMEQLLDYIVKLSTQRDEGSLTVTELRRVVITIFIVYSVLRQSEIQRAMLDITQIEQGMIIICTKLLKEKRGKLEVTLKRVENRAVCPIVWFESWNKKRKIKTSDWELLWRNSEKKIINARRMQQGSTYSNEQRRYRQQTLGNNYKKGGNIRNAKQEQNQNRNRQMEQAQRIC
ncbi:MAG: hypothetical protein EZS28_038181 [Streblomastix strix]|uniref:Tyr recombinase domain-containing protein n=1 Tax=Streblomastix strix TaxID=222440 RepID=A0A5J4U8Q8_9EUKA|nr:MAG: hypothetical protein EZS28_038181 [Streblomastix strix]